MKERVFQTELKKSLQSMGGYGVKLNPEWSVGIQDLLFIHQGQVAFVETKVSGKQLVTKDGVVKAKGGGKPFITIDMTPIQRARMKRVQDAGGIAGWCVAYRMNDDWYAVFGVDPEAAAVVPTSSTNIILRGEHRKWDVPSMMRQLANPNAIWDETRTKEDRK